MKRSKNNKKYTRIDTSHAMWIAIVLAVLFSLFFVFIFYMFIQPEIQEGTFLKNLGVNLFVMLLLGPVCGLCIGMTICTIRARKDYLLFTNQGLEMCLHPVMPFTYKVGVGFIPWNQIEACAVSEETTRGGMKVYVLLIKLVGEAETLNYGMGSLHGSGKQVDNLLKRYAPQCRKPGLVESVKNRTKDTMVDYIVTGVFMAAIMINLYTVNLYEQTFIASWWWLPTMLVVLLLAIPLRKFCSLEKSNYYFLAVSAGMFSWCCLLWVNLTFADMSGEPTVVNYEVVGSGVDKYRYYEPKNYYLKVDTGTEFKDIDISLEEGEQVLNAKSVDFYTYRGFLGFAVYRDFDLYY